MPLATSCHLDIEHTNSYVGFYWNVLNQESKKLSRTDCHQWRIKYHPLSLKDGEIRVITVLIVKDSLSSHESPIRCALQRVNLDEKLERMPAKLLKAEKGADVFGLKRT